jgi:hypothetical protein
MAALTRSVLAAPPIGFVLGVLYGVLRDLGLFS